MNTSTTPSPVFAEVSANSSPASAAYACASSLLTCRLLAGLAVASASAAGVAVASSASDESSSSSPSPSAAPSSVVEPCTRSILFPTKAITMLLLAWRCSSLTHDLAFSSDDCGREGESGVSHCFSVKGGHRSPFSPVRSPMV